MRKWIFTLLLWYIFVDNTPWIQEPEKKTVWILRPGWSTYKDCWDVKTRVYETFDGDNKGYLCVDIHSEKPPVVVLSPEEIINQLRPQLEDLIKQLRLMPKDILVTPK